MANHDERSLSMRTSVARASLFLGVSLVLLSSALADVPPGEGWKSLFNGKDLSG
jgi:hypothetical protein